MQSARLCAQSTHTSQHSPRPKARGPRRSEPCPPRYQMSPYTRAALPERAPSLRARGWEGMRAACAARPVGFTDGLTCRRRQLAVRDRLHALPRRAPRRVARAQGGPRGARERRDLRSVPPAPAGAGPSLRDTGTGPHAAMPPPRSAAQRVVTAATARDRVCVLTRPRARAPDAPARRSRRVEGCGFVRAMAAAACKELLGPLVARGTAGTDAALRVTRGRRALLPCCTALHARSNAPLLLLIWPLRFYRCLSAHTACRGPAPPTLPPDPPPRSCFAFRKAAQLMLAGPTESLHCSSSSSEPSCATWPRSCRTCRCSPAAPSTQSTRFRCGIHRSMDR